MLEVILVTWMAGSVVSTATFPNYNTCMDARNKVYEQIIMDEKTGFYSEIEAVCTYKDKKRDNSKQMFQLFGNMLNEMSKNEDKSTWETPDTLSGHTWGH